MRKKPKFLYHGSPYKLAGNKLIPKRAKDLGEVKANILQGVYASSLRKAAIAMAVISVKGVVSSSLDTFSKKFKKAIVYEGWPKPKPFYLYTLPSETFLNRPKGSAQWVSAKPVKPIKIEKLKVRDYLHLVRKATKKEIKEWFKRYGNKIKKLKSS